MEPLVIFGAGLVVYCGYLAMLDSTKAWRTCRMETAAKRASTQKQRVISGSRRRPGPATGIPGRPILQRV